MFNLGFQEFFFIGILAIIVIGPKELPAVARSVGRILNELKRATDGFKEEFTKTNFIEPDEKKKIMPVENDENDRKS